MVLVLLIFGVRGCLDSRKERAYKDYVRDVGALVQESDQESRRLFGLLADPDVEDQDIENQLNTFRNQSAQLVDRARGTDHPDEMDRAHDYLVETLEFRRTGVSQIADQLPDAIASQAARRTGTEGIADSMQNFLTSDVLYQSRVKPNIESALEEEDLEDEEDVPDSQSLPDIAWLQPSTVADRVGPAKACVRAGLRIGKLHDQRKLQRRQGGHVEGLGAREVGDRETDVVEHDSLQ